MALGFFNAEDTLTPESIERRRKLAESLINQGTSEQPIQHWTQGLARLAKAASGSYMDSRLNEADKANREYSNKLLASLLGGSAGAAQGSGPRVLPGAFTPDTQGMNERPQAGPVSRETNIFEDVSQQLKDIGGSQASNGPPAGAPSWAGGMPSGIFPGMLNPAGAPMPKPQQLAMAGQGGASDMPGMIANPGQPSEQELVVRTIAAEAGGKSPQEAQAIAAVILNRAKSRGLSPADVVLERNQFEPWNKGPGGPNDPMKINPGSPRYQQAVAALQAAQTGQDPTGGATHFVGTEAQVALGRPMPAWSQQGPAGQRIGATTFYAPEGRVNSSAPIPTTPQPGGAQSILQGPTAPAIPQPMAQGAVGAAMGGNKQAQIAQFLMDPRVPQSMKASVMPILSSMMAPGQVINRPDGSAYVVDPRTNSATQIMGPTGEKPGESRLRELDIQSKERELARPKTMEITGPDGEKMTVLYDDKTQQYRLPKIEGQPSGPQPVNIPGVGPVTPPQGKEAKKAFDKEVGERQAKAVLDAPQSIENANNALAVIGQMEKHPGLPGIVGKMGVFPNMPGGQAADAQAIRDQLQGKTFLEAFASLKGGGAISEVEGQKATEAIARLGKAQSEAAFRESLGELKGIIQRGLERARATGQRPSNAPPSVNPDVSGIITQAREAVAKGADPAKVRARLKERGVDPGAL